MPEPPIWESDPALRAEGEAEREKHRASSAKVNGGEPGISIEDFYAYMPSHEYIYQPTRELWPASSVNGRLPRVALKDNAGRPVIGHDEKPVTLRPSAYLDRFRAVEQMTWAPGRPGIIPDQLFLEGGWCDHAGVRCFNLYQGPSIEAGDPAKAGPWLEHLEFIYPDDTDHIRDWFAQRVQRPEEKINHALVLGGEQGIGKDTIIEPIKYSVGAWNFQDVLAVQMLGRFNGYLKAIILRVNEARDLGESDRFQFYDHLKSYTAAPPDTLRIDEKNVREYMIPNCCGVIITTNHKTDGIFLPADDRRHYVAWSNRNKEDPKFQNGYWDRLHTWYRQGGKRHVAAYLRQRDLGHFDPKAPPPKTAAFWAIVDANRAPEEAELADIFDRLGNPSAVALGRIQSVAEGEIKDWLQHLRNRRIIPHRLEKCGYVPVRNPHAKDGLWKINDKRQAVYARRELTESDQLAKAQALVSGSV